MYSAHFNVTVNLAACIKCCVSVQCNMYFNYHMLPGVSSGVVPTSSSSSQSQLSSCSPQLLSPSHELQAKCSWNIYSVPHQLPATCFHMLWHHPSHDVQAKYSSGLQVHVFLKMSYKWTRTVKQICGSQRSDTFAIIIIIFILIQAQLVKCERNSV